MKIHKITAPCAIMHGTEDEVVPCENGRALYRALQQPFSPLWIEGRGHNDMPDTEVFEYTRVFALALHEARQRSTEACHSRGMPRRRWERMKRA